MVLMREGSWHDLGSLLGGAGYTNCYTPPQYEDKDSQSHGNHQTDIAVMAIINSACINRCVRANLVSSLTVVKTFWRKHWSTEPLKKVQNEVQVQNVHYVDIQGYRTNYDYTTKDSSLDMLSVNTIIPTWQYRHYVMYNLATRRVE